MSYYIKMLMQPILYMLMSVLKALTAVMYRQTKNNSFIYMFVCFSVETMIYFFFEEQQFTTAKTDFYLFF